MATIIKIFTNLIMEIVVFKKILVLKTLSGVDIIRDL